jgi:hypothetical protein
VFRRNAEVLVPGSLPLDPALKFIACRSAAERQTLLHLLPPNLRRQWAPRIRLGEQGLFERKWTYVEEVITVDGERITTCKGGGADSTLILLPRPQVTFGWR